MIDIGAIPDRLQSELSVSGCNSEQEVASGTPPQTSLTSGVSMPHRQDRSWSIGHLTSPLGAAPDLGMGLSEAERKNTHVLVVEDK